MCQLVLPLPLHPLHCCQTRSPSKFRACDLQILPGHLTLAVEASNPAQVGHIHHTLFVDVHVAGVTLHPLADESIEHGATVVAECGDHVGMDLELVVGLGVV